MFENKRGHRKKPLSSPFSSSEKNKNKASQFIHYTGGMTILWVAASLAGELGGEGCGGQC